MYDGLQVFILALDDLTDQRMTWERHGSPVSSGNERIPIPPCAQTDDFFSRTAFSGLDGKVSSEVRRYGNAKKGSTGKREPKGRVWPRVPGGTI